MNRTAPNSSTMFAAMMCIARILLLAVTGLSLLLIGKESTKWILPKGHITGGHVLPNLKGENIWRRGGIEALEFIDEARLMMMGGHPVLVINTADNNWKDVFLFEMRIDGRRIVNLLFAESHPENSGNVFTAWKYSYLSFILPSTNWAVGNRVAQFFLSLQRFLEYSIRICGKEHLDGDNYPSRYRMADIRNVGMHGKLQPTLLEGYAFWNELNFKPRTFGRFQLTLRSHPQTNGNDSIDNNEASDDDLRPKLRFIAPIFLSVAGYLIFVWAWWSLYFRNPSGWRELLCGFAALGGL